MYLNNIPYIIHDLISKFTEDSSKIEIKKILEFKPDELYSLSFAIAGKAQYCSEQHNGSHENYIIYQLQLFIKESLKNQKPISSLKINFNFNDDDTYIILIMLEKIIIENEFIYMDKIKSDDIHKNRIEIEKEKKEMQITIWKHKLYNIICEKPNGIDLRKIIQKSRLIKNPETRKEILKTLIDEKRIVMEFDTGNGRKKRVYKLNE